MTRSAQTPRWQFLYVAIAPAHAERQVPYLAAPIVGQAGRTAVPAAIAGNVHSRSFCPDKSGHTAASMKRSPGACGEGRQPLPHAIGSARESLHVLHPAPNLGQFTGAQQPCQLHRIASVRLDPVTWLPRDHRRRNDAPSASAAHTNHTPWVRLHSRSATARDASQGR